MKRVQLAIFVKDHVTLEDIRQTMKKAGYRIDTMSNFMAAW